MPKYLCIHTVPANSITRDQAEEITKAAQRDATVKGYRSFISMSAGKVACVWDSPNADALANWFQKMNLPFDSISKVELEGYRGALSEPDVPFAAEAASQQQGAAAM